jgi:DTW domain-containing protein YfiP
LNAESKAPSTSSERSRRKPSVGRLEHPPQRPFRARGSFVKRCDDCQLPASHCICRFRPRFGDCTVCENGGRCGRCEPAAEFWLLMHPDERHKPTNTGRLIADCLPRTRIFTWHRKEPPAGFVELCRDPAYAPMIVFPAPPDRYEERLIDSPPATGAKPVFILLDGTWQQAGKMFRLTHYLQSLPVLSLSPNYPSRYRLRRSVHAGQLCTAEVAAELLQTLGAEEAALRMHSYLTVFSEHYSAARNNHSVREETEAMRFLAGRRPVEIE